MKYLKHLSWLKMPSVFPRWLTLSFSLGSFETARYRMCWQWNGSGNSVVIPCEIRIMTKRWWPTKTEDWLFVRHQQHHLSTFHSSSHWLSFVLSFKRWFSSSLLLGYAGLCCALTWLAQVMIWAIRKRFRGKISICLKLTTLSQCSPLIAWFWWILLNYRVICKSWARFKMMSSIWLCLL